MTDKAFRRVQDFHGLMGGHLPAGPKAFNLEEACYRADFKLEEIVELIAVTAQGPQEFRDSIAYLHGAIDKAVDKVEQKAKRTEGSRLVNQADALLDLLYLTYGSFVLLGVDPAPLFDIVHEANMGKIWPDGKAHYDPVTGKILKPDDWEERFAPESKIASAINRQLEVSQLKQSTEKSI